MTQQQDDTSPARGAPASSETAAEGPVAVIDARALFGDAREIGIHHDGALYRLKITRQGKLILNK